METKADDGATSMRLYEDFEPYCRRLTDQTLEIHLKGFKKEQLKVKTHKGILTISGERPLDASKNKWSRFRKEFKLLRDCDVEEIRAKFSAGQGILSIVIPKKVEPLKSEAEKESLINNQAEIERHSVWGVKIRKGTAIKVAVALVVVLVAVALGTQISHLLNKTSSWCCWQG